MTTLAQGTLVHSHIGQLAESSFFQLESETDKRRISGRNERDGGSVERKSRIESLVVHLVRCGEVRAHTVKHGLDGGVLDSGTHEDRDESPSDGRSSDSLSEVEVGDGLFVQELVADGLVALGQVLDELGAFLLDLRLDLGRDIV